MLANQDRVPPSIWSCQFNYAKPLEQYPNLIAKLDNKEVVFIWSHSVTAWVYGDEKGKLSIVPLCLALQICFLI